MGALARYQALKSTGYKRTIEGQNFICNEESPLGKD